MRRPGIALAMSRLVPALLALLAGCTALPEARQALPPGAGRIELAATPFFAQEEYQCGPAALSTVLAASGLDVDLARITGKVYVPARRGSLRAELLAAARTEGRIPVPIDGSLEAVWRELENGRPVLVLQNLGVAALPRWHYAVVVGIDADSRHVVLRSGTDRRRVTGADTFLRTWRRGDYWAIAVTRPGEVPAGVDRGSYLAAVAAYESAGREDAATAWQAAVTRWPESSAAWFGLGNAQFARGDYAAAEEAFRSLLERDASQAAVRNNLALTLAELGRPEEALAEIETAITDNRDPALEAELLDTRRGLLAKRRPSEP